MATTTAIHTRTTQPGAAIIAAWSMQQELESLYALQQAWLSEKARMDDAIDYLEGYGFSVSPHQSWCWADSPHAARIAEIEAHLGV